jgi:predicted RNA-binding Zn-ribbon protein involved in translation (DUF1610 family)
MTISIPTTYVDWHCRDCGHQHETNLHSYSYPVECPNCGNESINQSVPKLPVNFVYCDSEPHQYSFTSSDKQIQVYMRTLTGKMCGVAFDPDDVPDCSDDPIEVTREVLRILNTYWYTSQKEKVEAILKEMEDHKEESDKNEKINQIHKLRKSIVLNSLDYVSLVEELEEDVTPDQLAH